MDFSTGAALKEAQVSRAVAVVANRSHVAAKLRLLLRKAGEKFLARAYVHWYKEQGLEDDDFISAFDAVSSIVDAYDRVAS